MRFRRFFATLLVWNAIFSHRLRAIITYDLLTRDRDRQQLTTALVTPKKKKHDLIMTFCSFEHERVHAYAEARNLYVYANYMRIICV